MTHRSSRPTSRRRFLRTSGTALALIPLVNVAGCSDGGDEAASPSAPEAPAGSDMPSAAEARSAAEASAPAEPAASDASTPQEAPAAAPPAADLVRLEESDGTAQALGYRHDASQVDSSRYGRYQAGQKCSKCSLYQADSGEAGWGACSIFPGKLVNAEGWCSAYVPAA